MLFIKKELEAQVWIKMLVIVLSGYKLGLHALFLILYFYVYRHSSKKYINSQSQQGGPENPEDGGGGVRAASSRTELGVDPDNAFVQKVKEELALCSTRLMVGEDMEPLAEKPVIWFIFR